MLIAFLIVAQGAAVVDVGPAGFDLGRLRRRDCAADGSRDIVVCGTRDPERYRLRPLADDAYRDAAPVAETGIVGNLKGGAVMEGATVGGFRSNRLMLRLRTPF